MQHQAAYNLLIETTENVEVLTEQTDQGKQLYLEGVFAQSEVKNGNGRVYPHAVMAESVAKYNDQYVSKKRALGELSHPDYPFPKPENAAIRIVEMKMSGNDVHGKALILNTPKGQILKGLVEGGYVGGVSTRGLGNIKEKNQIKEVQRPFMMTAVDYVDSPSAPDAIPNTVLESYQWTLNEATGNWVPLMEEEESVQFNEQLFLERFESFLKSLRQ